MNYLFAFLFVITLAFNSQAQRVALTFDDAPTSDGMIFSGMERTKTLIDKLNKLGINQAAFFCVSQNLNEEGMKRIQMYSEAGHIIANHTHNHSRYSSVGINNFISEILIADSLLKKFSSFKKWFRFPFLNEGRTKEDRDLLRNALKVSGYFNAYVTVDNYDWYINNLVRNALLQDKKINYEKLRDFYLDHIYQSLIFYDEISRKYIGRSVNHVLLLHENDLAAMFIDDLVNKLRENGWEIISAEEAYTDEIATIIPNVLFNNQGRVAAIANSYGVKPALLVQQSEDEEFLIQKINSSDVIEND